METVTPGGPESQVPRSVRNLEDVLAQGYLVNYEDYFRRGFEIFKQEAGLFIAFLFVMLIAYAVAGALPFVGKFASILVGPLMMGILLMAARIAKNVPRQFESFLSMRDHYRELLIIVLIQSLITYLLTLVILGWGNFLVFMGWRQVDFSDIGSMMHFYSGQGKRYVFVWLPMLLLTTLWLFAPCFVIFRGYKGWDAMEASRQLVMKKFASWLGFVVLLGLFNIAGAICLVVGLLVTIPTSMCAVYVAFDELMGTEVHP